jgi:hypothetical protein
VLIYLDSGDIANLERVATHSVLEFDDFLTKWDELGCDLALSLHHAQETAQLADDSSRERRIRLLERFPRVRYELGGSAKIIHLETSIQLVGRAGDRARSYIPTIREALFADNGIEGFRRAVFESGHLLRMFGEAHGLTAKARQVARGVPRPRSFRRQTKEMINTDTVRQQLEENLAKEGHSQEVKDFMRRTFTAIMSRLQATPNMRSALEGVYGISGFTCLPTVPDDDLARVSVFLRSGEDIAIELSQLFGLPVGDLQAQVRQLDPYECPGLAIELALSRAQNASSQAAEISDEPDRAHAVFIPYVDAAFADRRTVGFLEQESHKPRNAAILGAIGGLHRSGRPEAILAAIASTKTDL